MTLGEGNDTCGCGMVLCKCIETQLQTQKSHPWTTIVLQSYGPVVEVQCGDPLPAIAQPQTGSGLLEVQTRSLNNS